MDECRDEFIFDEDEVISAEVIVVCAVDIGTMFSFTLLLFDTGFFELWVTVDGGCCCVLVVSFSFRSSFGEDRVLTGELFFVAVSSLF
jgi:hypothetical protein